MKINPKILVNAIDQLSTYVKNPKLYDGKSVLNIQQAQILGLMLEVNKVEISKMFDIIYNTATDIETLNVKAEKMFKMVNDVVTNQIKYSVDNIKKSSNVAYNILAEINNTSYKMRYDQFRIESKSTLDQMQMIGRALRGKQEPDIDTVIVLLNTIKAVMYKPLTVEDYLLFIKKYNLNDAMGLGVKYSKPEPVIEKDPEMDFNADDFNVKLVTLSHSAEQFHILLKVMKLAKISPSPRTTRILPFLSTGYFVVDLAKKEFNITDDVQSLSGCKLVYLQTLVDTLNIDDEAINAYLSLSKEPKKIPLGEPVTKPKEQVKILDFAGSEPVPKHETLKEIRESVADIHSEYLNRMELLINRTVSHGFNHAITKVVYLDKNDLDTYRKLVTSHYTGKATELQCDNCDKLVEAGLVKCKTYLNTNLGMIDVDYIDVIQETSVHNIFNVKGSHTQGFYAKANQPVYKISLVQFD